MKQRQQNFCNDKEIHVTLILIFAKDHVFDKGKYYTYTIKLNILHNWH